VCVYVCVCVCIYLFIQCVFADKETNPNLSDVTMYFVDIRNLEQNEVDPLICNNIGVNQMVVKEKITSTNKFQLYMFIFFKSLIYS